jgi:hypothetical protein
MSRTFFIRVLLTKTEQQCIADAHEHGSDHDERHGLQVDGHYDISGSLIFKLVKNVQKS